MKTDNGSRESPTPETRTRPSDIEVLQMLRDAARQYEESMRVADLADLSGSQESNFPRYEWDNPMGLVVTAPRYGKLV